MKYKTETSSTYRFASLKKITTSWFEFIDFPFFADKKMEGDTHPHAHISPSGSRQYNWLNQGGFSDNYSGLRHHPEYYICILSITPLN